MSDDVKIERVDDDSFRVRMTVSAERLAFVAHNLYEIDGLTHEEVTAWLEKHCPSFRDVLAEIHSDGGVVRWMVKPRSITRSYTCTARFE